MTVVSCSTDQVDVEASWGTRELVDRLAPEWRQLCSRGRRDEPFYRPEWASAYLRAFAPDAPVLLVEARVQGRLSAVLPLVRTSRGWRGMAVRKLSAAANIHSCRFDIPCEQGPVGEAAVAAIWAALRVLPGWDVIEIPRVPRGGAAETLMAAAAGDGYPVGSWRSVESPYAEVDLPPGADPMTLALRAQFRRDVKRRLRRATEQYDVRLRRVVRADPEALEAFFELEERGWKGTSGTAIACSAATRDFYTDVARAAAESGYLSLYFLEFDGTPVAAHLGLRHNGRYYLPKVAYDEAYARFTPGQLIVRAIVEDLATDGPAVIDLGGVMSQWKAEWAQGVLPHSSLFVFRRGPRGRAQFFYRFVVLAAARSAARRPALAPAAEAVLRQRGRLAARARRKRERSARD